MRRSIRESFRQRRNTTSTSDRRKIAESMNLETTDLSSKKVSSKGRPRASSEPTSPVNAVSSDHQVRVECMGGHSY